VHGNTTLTLRALAALTHRNGVVGGVSHGRARAKLFWGIGPGCRGESGGEVTGQGVDGGELALLGCPRWSWRWPGRRGVLTT
jgi:hypothetical protein